MGFKKFDGSVWQAINPKKLKGIPYTGTLPAVLANTKAGYLHKYKVYGNLEQTGTPSPENPIVPSECGERTKNLLNQNESEQGDGYVSDSLINASGRGATVAWAWSSEYISIAPETDYCLFSDLFRTRQYSYIAFYTAQKEFIRTIPKKCALDPVEYVQDNCTLFTTPANAYYMRVSIDRLSTMNLLAKGSTAPSSYIPYGYKLPLSSAGQDVDIYLGESQTTRRIRKLVLTGQETGTWTRNSAIISGNAYYNTSIFANYKARTGIGYCTHYPLATAATATIGVYFGAVVNMISAISEGLDTAEKWKTYLQQQYTNGTPVTVWYVLATEETGTLNEPLRKIGDYADTIDSTQTSAQIPTSANSTTISWGGAGLAPSQFDSIQEWVNIPTYKRVNGAWVADNSN